MPAATSCLPPARRRPPPLQLQARRHLLPASLCVLSGREYGGWPRLLIHDAEEEEEEEECVGWGVWQLQLGPKLLRAIKTTRERGAEEQ